VGLDVLTVVVVANHRRARVEATVRASAPSTDGLRAVRPERRGEVRLFSAPMANARIHGTLGGVSIRPGLVRRLIEPRKEET
jgi:hypothetical protein